MDYPKHEFSKYINHEMSSNNLYVSDDPDDKKNLAYKLKNLRCDGDIMLEPRLVEYLKKKQYFTDNNIKPCISLEREFQITNDDLQRIRDFMQGKRNIYVDENKVSKDRKKALKKSKEKKHRLMFPSSALRKDDPRVPKPKGFDVHQQVVNRGMFVADGVNEWYDEEPLKEVSPNMDVRDIQPVPHRGGQYGHPGHNATGFDFNDTRYDPRGDLRMYRGHKELETNDKNTSQYKVDWERKYDGYHCNEDPYHTNMNSKKHKKKKKSKRAKYPECRDDEKMKQVRQPKYLPSNYVDLGGDLSNNHFAGVEDGLNPGDLDELWNVSNRKEGKVEIDGYRKEFYREKPPKVAVNANKGLNHSYRDIATDFDDFDGLNDIEGDFTEIETCMQHGMPSNTRKSYGYRNDVEHKFQYINEDFNDPDHTVLPFPRGGVSTRLQNKRLNSEPHRRDTY